MKTRALLLFIALSGTAFPAYGGAFLFGGQATTATTEAKAPDCNCTEKNPLLDKMREAVAVRASCAVTTTNMTFYNANPKSYRSKAERKLEGGAYTQFDEKLNSVEQSIKNGRPVSLSGDEFGEFGRSCNQKERRCTLLITVKGFSNLYRNYKDKFPHLPKDTFIGIVEDKGEAFAYKGTKKLDAAVVNRAYAASVPDSFKYTKWRKIENPCGKSASARNCDLSNIRISDKCF